MLHEPLLILSSKEVSAFNLQLVCQHMCFLAYLKMWSKFSTWILIFNVISI